MISAMKSLLIIVGMGLLLCVGQAATPRLKIAENKRFLVTADGQPFFWLGDTTWELFHRLNREQAIQLLENRAALKFNVLQSVAIAELEGHTDPNPYGHLPFVDLDVTRPAVKDGPQNDYWDHVDFIVREANQRGLYIGFLPTWGRFWRDTGNNRKPLFTVANAETYGEWLGKRYRDSGLIWILGGDRDVASDDHREIMRAMAKGLRRGDGGAHLMTFHPPGGRGSAEWFHDEPWLDFNMRQNGHTPEFTGRYHNTRLDYDRNPTKPVLDGEPIYEDHPVSFKANELGHSISSDVRRPLYWNLFSGAFGHTYGHHSVWQMWSPGKAPINGPLMPWSDAIQQPGAAQMRHGRALMESRPFLTRVPDDSIIVTDRVATSVPGAGRYRFVATRDKSGSYAMIYAPVGRKFSVNLDKLSGAKVKAWWFNPRTGKPHAIGTFAKSGVREFTPPDHGEMIDWVLVLDDAAKKFPAPGARKLN